MEAPTPNTNQEKNIKVTFNEQKYNFILSTSKNDLTIHCEILEINENI